MATLGVKLGCVSPNLVTQEPDLARIAERILARGNPATPEMLERFPALEAMHRRAASGLEAPLSDVRGARPRSRHHPAQANYISQMPLDRLRRN